VPGGFLGGGAGEKGEEKGMVPHREIDQCRVAVVCCPSYLLSSSYNTGRVNDFTMIIKGISA
jgi:hypothetical protein